MDKVQGSSRKIMDDIERLRGFACLIVFIHHIAWICPVKFIYNIVPYRLLTGESGVFLFFAISGFVVTLSLRDKIAQLEGNCFLERLNSAKSLIVSFYKRRFFRIVPVMMLGILLTGLFLVLNESNYDWLTAWLRSIPELFFGVFQYSEELYQSVDPLHDNGMGPMWTLALEAQFYMLWPIVLLICGSNNSRALTALLGGCLFLFIIQPVVAGFIGIKYYAVYGQLPCLLLGAFLAFLYTDEDMGKNVGKISAKIITAVLAMALWYYPNAIDRTYFCRMPIHLGSVLLLMFCAFVKDSFNFPILGSIFKFLGSRSYSFYIIQLPLASLVVFYTNSMYFPKESLSNYYFYMYQFIIYVAVVAVATEVVYRCVEKPLRKLGRK